MRRQAASSCRSSSSERRRCVSGLVSSFTPLRSENISASTVAAAASAALLSLCLAVTVAMSAVSEVVTLVTMSEVSAPARKQKAASEEGAAGKNSVRCGGGSLYWRKLLHAGACSCMRGITRFLQFAPLRRGIFCSELLLSRVTDELARASIVGQRAPKQLPERPRAGNNLWLGAPP